MAPSPLPLPGCPALWEQAAALANEGARYMLDPTAAQQKHNKGKPPTSFHLPFFLLQRIIEITWAQCRHRLGKLSLRIWYLFSLLIILTSFQIILSSLILCKQRLQDARTEENGLTGKCECLAWPEHGDR